jgi:ceramide glucosyltransferase
MEGFILGAMTVVLFILAALILVGGRALKGASAPGADVPSWPAVALMVPVTGAPPGLAECLNSWLTQDYPDYQVVFATRDGADAAISVIRKVIQGRSRARHVVGGAATACGQKNHNLLAALKLVGEAPEVLAFVDANQLAPPTFLTELVRPLALGEAQVTSGYHHIVPRTPQIVALGRAICVLTLYLTKGFSRLNQPWGGATAITRARFASLQVARLWAENVVDDVSLAARLVQARIRVGSPPGAVLLTPLDGESLAGWSTWLTRQWIYLKFCLPGTWLAAGFLQHLLTALVVLAVLRVGGATLGWVPGGPALAAALFLVLLTGAGAALRPLHPAPGPWPGWLTAFYGAILMGSYCHFRTWFSQEIPWRGLTYRVTWRGRVTAIREG